MAGIDEMWSQAFANPGASIDIGRTVVCDICNEDFTDSNESGGFLLGSYAYCPRCAGRMLPDIKRFGEEHLIGAHCAPGVSFADFVRALRGGDNTIRVIPGVLRP